MLVSLDKSQLELVHTEPNGREIYRVGRSQGYRANHFEMFTTRGETLEDWNANVGLKHLGVSITGSGSFDCSKG